MEIESKTKIIIGSKLVRPLLTGFLLVSSLGNIAEAQAVDPTIQPLITNSQSYKDPNYLRVPIIFDTVHSEEETQQNPELIKLETYLSSLKVDEDRLRQIVEENDIFAGFKNFTQEQRVDDFNRYFPIYRAVELKYGVHWLLLWIIHADETTVSRDLGNDQGDQALAMQITKSYAQFLKEATIGWEDLKDLPNQRDARDYEEIFKAGLYIHNKAEQVKIAYGSQMSDTDAVLKVVGEYYSAPEHGQKRVAKFKETESLFN